MKTEIGQLNLSLPAGFEKRAQRIGRLVGAGLASRQDLPAGNFDAISVGPLRLEPSRSDRAISESIVTAIVKAIVQSS